MVGPIPSANLLARLSETAADTGGGAVSKETEVSGMSASNEKGN